MYIAILGALGKIVKANYKLHYVCPSLHIELGLHWTNLHMILYEEFWKICQENTNSFTI
jgi:hypothetical protein